MKKLLIKFPNRSRPEAFRTTLDRHYETLSGEVEYEFLITLDNDDAEMNNPEIRSYLDGKKNLVYCFGDSKSKIEAVNADMACATPDWDVVVVTSVDMVPQVHGWDKFIVDAMRESFPDSMGCTWFNDGRSAQTLNCLPILGRKLYEHFGYIYHPAYLSLFADNEMTDVYGKMGVQKYIDNVIIKHEWTAINKEDELHKKNESYYRRDQRVYLSRKRRGFKK